MANPILSAARRVRETKQRRVVPFVSSWQAGRPIFTDWSTENAIQNGLKASTWVYRANRILADNVSSVPWYVERRYDDETWEREKGHPIEVLLREANPFMTGQDLFERLTYHLNLGGNGLWQLILVRGVPIEIWPLLPDRIKPVPDRRRFISHYEVTRGEDRGKTYKPEEIVHFMFTDPSNPYWGMSPLQAVGRVVDTDVEAVRWNKVALQNRAVKDGFFFPHEPLTREQWEEARQMFREELNGADNARGIWVASGPGDLKSLTMSPAEMDWLNTRKANMEEIVAAYGVAAVLLTGHGTFRNYETALKALWQLTLIPILDDLKQALNLALVPFWDPDSVRAGVPAKIRIVYDLSNVPMLQENFNDKIEAAERLWRMNVPFHEINQRLELGFDEIPGGDLPRGGIALSTGIQGGGVGESAETAASRARRRRKANEWTDEQKATYWQQLDDDRQQWEERIGEEVAARFLEEAEFVAAAYEASGESAALQMVDEQATEWRALLEVAYTAVIEHFGSLEVERLDDQAKSIRPRQRKQAIFDPFGDAVRAWIAEAAAAKVTEMSDTTKEQIAEAILAGVENLETSQQIARRIRSVYQEWAVAGDSAVTRSRAMTIARTETGAAMGFGNFEAGRQFVEETGLTMETEWISSRDARVRETHALIDGERVPLGERFSNGLRYPGDPDGEPEEVINCRCAAANHVVTG